MFGRNLTGRGQRGGMGLGSEEAHHPGLMWAVVEVDFPDAATILVAGQICLRCSGVTREQEINLLKSQAENIKKELDMVETRIHDLEAGK